MPLFLVLQKEKYPNPGKRCYENPNPVQLCVLDRLTVMFSSNMTRHDNLDGQRLAY